MQTITTIGLDIAKSVFQVHGIDAEDRVIIRRQLKRRYVLAFFQKLRPACQSFLDDHGESRADPEWSNTRTGHRCSHGSSGEPGGRNGPATEERGQVNSINGSR
jgi:transposase